MYLASRSGGTGGILEAGPGRGAVGQACRAAGAVLAAPATRAARSRGSSSTSDAVVPGRRPIAASSRVAWSRGGGRLAAGLDEEPGAAAPAGARHRGPRRSLDVRLSTVSGPAVRSAGTAAAASTSSANPSTSRTPAAGGATSRSVTDETTAHVPSVPVRARATYEATLRQQPVEGIPGHAARPGRQLGAEQVRVTADERAQPGVERRAELVARARRAVGRDEAQREDVLGRGAPGDRVRAAGIVADHAADRAPRVRRGVRPHPQAVGACGRVDVVEHRARGAP